MSVHRCLERYSERNSARMYAREGEKGQGHGLTVSKNVVFAGYISLMLLKVNS